MPDPEALGKVKKGGNCFVVYDAKSVNQVGCIHTCQLR